ncbi:hypothetical protein IF2G_03867 [Cordyceps javanica]|nr:hypothetical protein IF2G_03867 [Cordyceps javanica]
MSYTHSAELRTKIVMQTDDQIASPDREAIEAAENVYHTVQRAFPEAVADFESKWAAFQVVCRSLPTSARYSSLLLSIVRANSGCLAALVTVRERTSSRLSRSRVQKSFSVNALVNDPEHRRIPDNDLISKEVLQRYANQIVELSFRRNNVYKERVKAWKEHCAEFKLLLSRCVCCAGDEYWDLLDVGPAFIPHLMVEYSHERGGYWYELIHEIIHGHTTEAYAIFERDKWFDVWREFLNGGEYEQAPKYIPNEWDIYFSSAGKKTGPQLRECFRQSGR